LSKNTEPKYIPALRFNWLTPFYDAVVGFTTRERRFKTVLIEQACINPENHVLDLASGTGTLAIWVKQHQPGANVTGVDGDTQILAIAAKKAKKANVTVIFDEALSYALPYPSDHFDKVLSSLFFHHLSWENKQRTIQQVFRVLKPGAELHVADWGRATNSLMRVLFYFIQLLDGYKNTQDNVSGKLPELFKQAGFVQVTQPETFSTIFGTMALYSATKPV